LYGKPMRVAFVRWLRGEQKFDSLELLAAQIGADCEAARQVLTDLGL
jgi:riboflavin kinase/FMN adenylyltransferase